MFVYYKLYREPVSPTISTNQEKIAVPSIEVVHEKTRSIRTIFFFF